MFSTRVIECLSNRPLSESLHSCCGDQTLIIAEIREVAWQEADCIICLFCCVSVCCHRFTKVWVWVMVKYVHG